jgi:two-component system OmpR family response regulator
MEKWRVLLIDDEEELVTTLVERLQFRGIEAEAATSGARALEALERGCFQAAVLDLKMPGLSGLDVMEVIRRKHPGTKIILITGHGAEEEVAADSLPGSVEILLKPFSIDVLIEAVQAALKR